MTAARGQNTSLQEKAPEHSAGEAGNAQAASRPAACVLDELDWSILKELAIDARSAFQGIADKLKVDEKTVRNRVARLRLNDAIQFLTLVDANLSDKSLVLLAGINATPEARAEGDLFANRLAELRGVSWCGRTIGRFDYILESVHPSLAALREFETNILPSFPGISSCESFFVVSHHGGRKTPLFPIL